MIPGVYIHRTDDIDIKYIGYTKDIYGTRPFNRWSRNEDWMNYMKDKTFTVELIECDDNKSAMELEEFLIENIGLDNLLNQKIKSTWKVVNHTKEVKERISKAMIEIAKDRDEDYYYKASKYRRKPIFQYTLNGTFIKKFNSVKEARTKTNILHLDACARGERNKAGGYIWKYEN